MSTSIAFNSPVHTPVLSSERALRYARASARIALGLIFFGTGLAALLHLVPEAPPPPEAAAFASGLASTGYFFPLLKGTEVVVGALLLANRLVPLALVVLAPIVINIVLFHVFLCTAGLGLGIFVALLTAVVAWTHKSAFRPLFATRG